jgi:hypothetical protein
MKNRAALFALAAAPIVAAGAGVVAARVIPFWPFRLIEAGYAPDEAASSCVEEDVAAEAYGDTIFTKEVDGAVDPWRIDVQADAPDCVAFDVFNLLGRAQCTVRAPAHVLYRNADGERAYRIETIGEHRVRASRHGLSCRQLN